MFDTQKIYEQCDITHCAKNRTVAHIISLNNRISCVVEISIL